MSEEKMMRLSQAARKVNVALSKVVEFLASKGMPVENNPNAKISPEQFNLLIKEFESSAMDKMEASGLTIGKKHSEQQISGSDISSSQINKEADEELFIKNLIVEKNASDSRKIQEVEDKKQEEIAKAEADRQRELERVAAEKTAKNEVNIEPVVLQGIKVVGKIELESKKSKKSEPSKKSKKSEEKPKEIISSNIEETNNQQTILSEENIIISPITNINSEFITQPNIERFSPIETEDSINKINPVSEEEIIPEHLIKAEADTLKGLTVLGKIELPDKKKKENPSVPPEQHHSKDAHKKKRARLNTDKVIAKPLNPNPNNTNTNQSNFKKGPKDFNRKPNQPNTGNNNNNPNHKAPLSDKDIQDKIKATLAKLSGNKPSGNRAKYRKEKRSAIADATEERLQQEQENAKVLKVTEFVSANDLASLMEVTVNEVIKVCLSMGMFVSINQRLDAEAITVIADEFGFEVHFINIEEEENNVTEELDTEEDLEDRAPIVTIMGHVDHGKTSLLDYIRKSKVAAGEAGGITQHIGAYSVKTDSGKKITFLDTPGHEAFTAMRARGAKLTDIVIIVVAADDSVMPQTKEAINHAIVAGVPIIIALNKIDKPGANPDKVKEELSKENILVEDWGGKYQCELISAKTGLGIPELLEKILLEAELLDLKANPNKKASGTVIEGSLDKGRGYLATVLVQTGTLKVGDVILAGAQFGKVKAMTDYRGVRIEEAGPCTPVQVLGLPGAPAAGDKFNAMENEREAREIATKREQLLREQSLRTKKHITLDEIGRRLAIGSFKELNIIVKGDVDGSVEALSDSLLKLSTSEVQVRIIHKGVGQISESDVLLASASDAVIIGFQVRPSISARKLAEQEQIDIRLYSVIYDAIDQLKDAMEGMLAPSVEEVIMGTIEVREVFKISKIGTVAGCYVTDGNVKRNTKIRLIRDGIVIHTGNIDALKRFKDDVSEVKTGYECGISIKGFNDILVGDTIEGFDTKEVKRLL
ncbi:MAG: translation initiation factor IF-2 [Cytophagales bacterium]|nr:MAG: translation initiation factor IF-2 [Cytophagales bacterium]